MLTRRTFISWLGAFGSAIGLRGRSGVPELHAMDDGQPAALDARRVTSVGEAVLPSELGESGAGRVSRAFTRWVTDFRAGAELVHSYGSAAIRVTGESPVGRWRSQLDALDRAARDRHRRGFSSLTIDQRRALLAEALADDRSSRLPDPIAARHVALALVSWFNASPEATNLCYRARIDANQCRPLVNSPKEPVALTLGGQGTRDGTGAALKPGSNR